MHDYIKMFASRKKLKFRDLLPHYGNQCKFRHRSLLRMISLGLKYLIYFKGIYL